jgi:hypothetical protein
MKWKYKTDFEIGLAQAAKWEKLAAEKLKTIYIPKKSKKTVVSFKNSQRKKSQKS